jgi:hypothetical protein
MAHPNRRINEQGEDASQRAAAERALFSEFLVAARQRAGCSIDDIALVTKVPARHLEALEQGRVDELPRGVYRRAIIRTYSAAVGLDTSLVLERFAHAFGADTAFSEWQMVPAPMRPPTAALVRQPTPAAGPVTIVSPRRVISTRSTRARRDRNRARWAGVAVAGAVVATVGAYLGLRPEAQSPRPTATTSAIVEITPAAATVPAVATPVRVDSPVLQAAAASIPAPVSRRTAADAIEPTTGQLSPPAEIEALLVITSNPAGARVTVDGVGWGVTPITIRHLSPGVKVVRVTKDGYVGQEQEVRLGESAVAAQLTLPPRN